MDLFKADSPLMLVVDEVLKYKNIIIVLGATSGVFFGGYYFYNSYREGIEARAHADLVEYLEYFDARVADKKDDVADEDTFDSQETKWNKVAQVFREGYEKHSNSGLAPIFLMHESEALLSLGKNQEAINSLEKALSIKMPAELKHIYLVKLALMHIDNGNKDGVKLLEAFTDEHNFVSLSSNSELGKKFSITGDRNFVHDLALYRLGEYYWYHGDFKLAGDYWNRLVLKYGKNTKSPSTWSIKAEEKLKLIES